MKNYIAHLTYSGDVYYIPADVFDEEVDKYNQSVETDWEYATECETGFSCWISESRYLKMVKGE